MPHECVLCMEVDSEENPLLELPCFSHWVCSECIPAYFVNATNNESLFPPQCCEEPIPIENYEEYIPVSVKLAYDLKEQGEYTILPKYVLPYAFHHITYSHRYRVYCAGEACGKFVHPSGHIEDKESNVTYAICDYCFQGTCCACKTLLIDDIQDHVCRAQESNEEFKEFADKEGYKDCFACGATVELAEGTTIPSNILKLSQLFWFKQSLNYLQIYWTTTFESFYVKLDLSFSSVTVIDDQKANEISV